MADIVERQQLMTCVNEFKSKNYVLILKSKEIVEKVRGMKESCKIAKNVGGGVALSFMLFNPIVAALGAATKYGTILTEKVSLEIFCAEIKALAEDRDRGLTKLSEIIHSLAPKYGGDWRGFSGLPFAAKDVLKRVDNWNGNPSVEDLNHLIEDLEKEVEQLDVIITAISRSLTPPHIN